MSWDCMGNPVESPRAVTWAVLWDTESWAETEATLSSDNRTFLADGELAICTPMVTAKLVPGISPRETPVDWPRVTRSEFGPETVTGTIPLEVATVKVWKAVFKDTGLPLESSECRTMLKMEAGSLPPAMVKLKVSTLKLWPGSTVESWGVPWVMFSEESEPGRTVTGSPATEVPNPDAEIVWLGGV